MTQAYWTAAIPNMKNPPRLEALLVPIGPKPRKPWQEIKAALLFAMPPTNTRQ